MWCDVQEDWKKIFVISSVEKGTKERRGWPYFEANKLKHVRQKKVGEQCRTISLSLLYVLYG